MKINDLPEPLKNLAQLRHKEKPHLPRINDHNNNLSAMFEWSSSPEKDAFWRRIDREGPKEEDVQYAIKTLGLDSEPLLFN